MPGAGARSEALRAFDHVLRSDPGHQFAGLADVNYEDGDYRAALADARLEQAVCCETNPRPQPLRITGNGQTHTGRRPAWYRSLAPVLVAVAAGWRSLTGRHR
jgi:hypothetical protein